ncbi:site-specific DNA-methyltransferase [Sporanaerobacter acetigenes]|uniref:DNA-methyltransferase n=1 Tax=Sporanaerobacter acetigenes TaxID=165813 RepID=UPI002FCDF157
MLALELENLKELDFDVDAALEEESISNQGDIWLLGRHRLICGDSTKVETYEKLMEGNKANLCVTDPPYNVNYTAGSENERKIKNDNMEDKNFYEFLLALFKNIFNSLEDGAAAYVFHADTEGLNFRKAFKDAGFHLANVCIWAKQSLVLGRSDYQWQHEPILYGWKPTGKHRWYSDRKQTTIWNFDRPTKSELHPTMKPVPLVAYPIQNSSMSNCIVLEPFAGSGSTLIACEQTGRICYAIELDEKYSDVIVKRYIEYVGSDEEVFLIRDGEKIPYKDTI